MTQRPTVLVTRKLPDEVEAQLATDFETILNPDDIPLDAGGLRTALQQADAVLCTVTDRLDAEMLGAEPLRTRLLANFGVGYNHIDIEAARARGIVVTNTPGVLTDDTADLTMLLLLMIARRAGEAERLVRAGMWTGWGPTQMLGTAVSGKTLGIIGLGRIGRAVARRAHAGFGMRILFNTPNPPPEADALALGAEPRALDDLLGESDFVSLHCPATPATRHLIDARALGLMRRGAYLINTARGDVVDEAALVEALESKRIAGAALDVYEREPEVPAALIRRDDVVLLPHLGSATREARIAMGQRAVKNIRAFFAGREVPDRV